MLSLNYSFHSFLWSFPILSSLLSQSTFSSDFLPSLIYFSSHSVSHSFTFFLFISLSFGFTAVLISVAPPQAFSNFRLLQFSAYTSILTVWLFFCLVRMDAWRVSWSLNVLFLHIYIYIYIRHFLELRVVAIRWGMWWGFSWSAAGDMVTFWVSCWTLSELSLF